MEMEGDEQRVRVSALLISTASQMQLLNKNLAYILSQTKTDFGRDTGVKSPEAAGCRGGVKLHFSGLTSSWT